MPNLILISGDKKPISTGDGSISFYNLTYKQAYHAKSIGTFTESLHKFVIPSEIVEKLKKGHVRLLDICLGIGANLAVTFHEIEKLDIPKEHRLQIVSLEKDHSLHRILKDDGKVVTYSCAKGVREDMKKAGFAVSDIPRLPDGFQSGTVAMKN